MKRRLELYQVDYTLSFENVTKCRFCLAFSPCHSVQVLIRSLVDEGIDLNDIHYESTHFIKTYR